MANPRLIGSVDKALLVLQRLGEFGPDGRPLSRLASDLGLNKGSLHHTLSVLRYRGFVEQDSKGNYRLGQRHCRWLHPICMTTACGRFRKG